MYVNQGAKRGDCRGVNSDHVQPYDSAAQFDRIELSGVVELDGIL